MNALQRFCLLALGTWIPLFSIAQKDSSFVLADMLVKGIRFKQFQTGIFVQEIDSVALLNNRNVNLDQLLAQSSGIFIKSYGPSQISSSSSRGSNAQQNAVLWNGFNISNPILGMQDLSLLPVFLFDDISIQYGAQASLYGSGNMGSALHLSSAKKSPKGLHIHALSSLGSFVEINGGIKSSWSSEKWQISEKVYLQQANNNFSYTDINGNQITMKFAAVEQAAWMQDLIFQANKKHSFQFNSWLQKNNREIPPADASQEQSAKQLDNSTRLSAEYRFKPGAYQLSYRSSYFNDQILFTDIGLEENHSIGEQFNQAIDQTYTGKTFQVLLSTQAQFLSGISKEYAETKKRDIKTVFCSIKKSWMNHKIELELGARQEWYKGLAVPFIPTMALQYKTTSLFTFRGRYGRNYRLPTFNDLYWVPGGNPNLHPEDGNFAELGMSIANETKNFPKIHLNIYERKTNNQITWIPQSSSRWQAVNLGKVESRGIEFFWDYGVHFKKMQFTLKGQHDYCSAINKTSTTDPGYNKQLIYTPRIKHNLQVTFTYNSWNLSYAHQYVGQRFYSSDNTESLGDYTIGNLFLTKSFRLKRQLLYLQLKRYNCFNSQYEIVLNRPMPGASNQICLQYQF